MRKNGRKKDTFIHFKGVAADGGFVFEVVTYVVSETESDRKTAFKMTAYEYGVMEIAIDYTETISRVAELVSEMFLIKEHLIDPDLLIRDFRDLTNLDFIILNYRNIRLQIGKNTSKKNIIHMLAEAMSASDYKDSDNEVFVDTQICNPYIERGWAMNDRYYRFIKIVNRSKGLLFSGHLDRIIITSLKDGIVTIDYKACCSSIPDFIAKLKIFFMPYSNFYGIKAIEVEFDRFSIRVDARNVDWILYLYEENCDKYNRLLEKKMQEYYNSSEYIREHAKILKKENRKKTVIQKVRQFQKQNTDFTIVDKKKQEEWENCKDVLSKDDDGKCLIEYVILWAQHMEYLMTKHNKKLSEIWDMSSHYTDSYCFQYESAVSLLASVWKYGEELRVQYNSKYNRECDVNIVLFPEILLFTM